MSLWDHSVRTVRKCRFLHPSIGPDGICSLLQSAHKGDIIARAGWDKAAAFGVLQSPLFPIAPILSHSIHTDYSPLPHWSHYPPTTGQFVPPAWLPPPLLLRYLAPLLHFNGRYWLENFHNLFAIPQKNPSSPSQQPLIWLQAFCSFSEEASPRRTMADQVVSQTLSPGSYDSQEELRPLSSGIRSQQDLSTHRFNIINISVTAILSVHLRNKNYKNVSKEDWTWVRLLYVSVVFLTGETKTEAQFQSWVLHAAQTNTAEPLLL